MAQLKSQSSPEKAASALQPLAEKTVTQEQPKVTKGSLQYQRDKEREKVKGIFRFHEVPGGTLSFCFKKYKGDPVERFDLVDGNVYSVPLGVAKHLNTNGAYPVHQHILNESGAPGISVGRMVRRFSFQSLEFVDTDDLPMTRHIEEVSLPPLTY